MEGNITMRVGVISRRDEGSAHIEEARERRRGRGEGGEKVCKYGEFGAGRRFCVSIHNFAK